MLLSCPGCQVVLPAWLIRTKQADSTCPNCYTSLRVELFPAAFRQWDIAGDAAAVVGNEAACYEHPGKPAKSVCHRCGRFVCALCEVEMNGAVWCPGCLHTPAIGSTGGEALETERTNYDSIALALATWPVVGFVYLSMLTAPVALYVVIRYWRRPLSLVPRNRWRFVVAAAVAGIELVALCAVVYAVIFALQQRGLRR